MPLCSGWEADPICEMDDFSQQIILSYGLNSHLLGQDINLVEKQNRTMLVCDWNEWGKTHGLFSTSGQFNLMEWHENFRYPHQPLIGKPGINVGYLDGHAKSHDLVILYDCIQDGVAVIAPDLLPGAEPSIPETITVPSDLPPGQYEAVVREDGSIVITPIQ